MSEQSKLMSERYGLKANAPKRSRRNVTVLASILLVAFLAWAASTALTTSAKIEFDNIGYKITSANSAQVQFKVTLPPNAISAATCSVQILNKSYAVVGYKEIEISASSADLIDVQVNTTDIGVTGSVDRCWFK
ncbi:MAG: hypothetical protein RLZZ229_495 [Actinomycetota bacterium]|jgi:hypothetical protein